MLVNCRPTRGRGESDKTAVQNVLFDACERSPKQVADIMRKAFIPHVLAYYWGPEALVFLPTLKTKYVKENPPLPSLNPKSSR